MELASIYQTSNRMLQILLAMKASLFILGLILCFSPILSAQMLITSGEPWKFMDTGLAPASTGWKGGSSFDDASWRQGPSPLGYGDDGERTIVSYGSSPQNKYITTYFRKALTVADLSGTFTLNYKRDDGIVIYINGTELLREYMPTGPITNATLAAMAVPEAEEPLWKTITLPANLLRAGANIIAAEVHQASATSSDIRFDLELRRSAQSTAPLSTSPLSGTPINSGGVWQYLVTASDPAANWKSDRAFTDTNAPWFAGKSPLGYGGQGVDRPNGQGPLTITEEGGTCLDECVSNPAMASTCKKCADYTKKQITTYFRKTVNLTNVAASSFTMRYQRDDGIAIYINGIEVARENLSPAASYSTTASAYPADADELTWVTVDPAKFTARLQEGANLVAVEIHQYSASSSDIRFNLTLQQNPSTITLERGPYLQRYSDEPTLVIAPDKRSMTVRWSTNVAAVSKVVYKKKTDSGSQNPGYEQAEQVTSPKAYSWTDGTNRLYDVHVTLNNLEPDTPYAYTLLSGTSWWGDETYYFRTAPSIGASKKTRMWVLGDFGKVPDANGPGTDQINVRNSFNDYIRDNVVYTPDESDKYVDLWLWLGDNAYGWGVTEQYQRSVFDVYDGRKNVYAQNPLRIMRQTPVFATPGNHDYHDGGSYNNTPNRKDHSINHYYDVVNQMTTGDAVGEHSRHEEYYSFDHANIHFVSLDTYGYEKDQSTLFPANSEQLAWLNRDLARAQASDKIKWIIVFFHHSPYTMGSKNSDSDPELVAVREKLVKDVLEKYRVDLVLSGHSHTYERSRPMHGHYGESATFSTAAHLAPDANNGLSSGRYDGTANSCFYYKNASDPKNHIVYVVNGSGGEVESVQPGWPHKAMLATASFNESGSMYIEVEKDRLDAKFITGSGQVKDQFTIIKDTKSFILPQTDGQTRRAVCECTDPDGWTHYTDLYANLLLSIRKNGNAIGKAWDSDFDLRLQGTPGVTAVPGAYPANYAKSPLTVMNRYWTIKTRGIPVASTVSIRHYWDNEDYNQLTYNTGARWPSGCRSHYGQFGFDYV